MFSGNVRSVVVAQVTLEKVRMTLETITKRKMLVPTIVLDQVHVLSQRLSGTSGAIPSAAVATNASSHLAAGVDLD